MSLRHGHNPLDTVWQADAGDTMRRAGAWLRCAVAGVLCAYVVACVQNARATVRGPDANATAEMSHAAEAGTEHALPSSAHLAVIKADLTDAGDESVAFVSSLKDIFLAEGVPCELVWIAEVESGFDVWAVSVAGAAGLFQLMPETAERFGIRVASESDERFDPVLNSRAAARYLKFLHVELGSWTLAVAAYHAGEGCVRRALAAVGGSRYSDIAGALPEKTRDYVVRVLNVIDAAEGISAADLPAPAS
jgi:hypothetical protein